MTGRNDPCPCGSGKKFKRCCGRTAQKPSGLPRTGRPVPPEVIAESERRRHAEDRRRAAFGETREIVSTEFAGHRIVTAGNTVYWGKNWKSFTDFLLYYIKATLGTEWGNAELAKPKEERHPILQWYEALCQLQRRDKEETEPNEHGLYSTVLDGPSRAYLLLAYELYVVRNHAELQESLVRRLKHADQFQGARYELFVIATMIRAGFTVRLEDESDVSRKHPELVAIHRPTGEEVAVEAKSRHRPGVLGRPGEPPTLPGFRAGLRSLVRDAIRKKPSRPYVIFVDANMPPEVASPLSIVDWASEVNETIAQVDDGKTAAGLYVGSGFNLLVVTNTPDHYGSMGGQLPGYQFYPVRPGLAARPIADRSALDAIEAALTQAANIPSDFPEESQ